MAAEPTTEVVSTLGHETLAEARALVSSPAVEAVSTDVFDTLVWRRVAEPAHAFAVLGERLAGQGRLAVSLSPGAFGELRGTAERAVRERFLRAHGQSEIRLSEVYEAIPRWVFNGAPRADAMDEEIALERDLVVPDLDVLELLRLAHEHGKALVAVSDSYLSATQLRELLHQPALSSLAFAHLFTSSDHRENKSGQLWDIVLETLGTPPGRVLHIGDNEQADVECPGERGVRTCLLRRRSDELQSLLDSENAFRTGSLAAWRARPPRSPSGADFGLTALRAKMEHRTELAQMPSALAPFWRFGATVYGPVFAGFSEWVHESAKAVGATQALCLMREGGFLAELINSGAPAVRQPVTAQPLWVNRDLCARAAIGSCTVAELEAVVVRRTPPTVAQLCRQLGIAVNDLPALTDHADTSLTDPVIRTIALETISESAPVRQTIVAMARTLRERIVTLLDSLIPEGEPVVVVDLGWGASIQRRLVEVLEQAGRPRRVIGLYLLTHEGAADAVLRGCEINGFLANCGSPRGVSDLIMRSPEVLEQSLMPAHGTQVDLDEDLNPVLAQTGAPSLQDVESESVRRGALSFQREYVRYAMEVPGKLTPLSSAPEALAPLIVRSATSPTSEEARQFGRWMHDENQGSERADSIVSAEWSNTLRHLSPVQLKDIPMDDLYWPFGLARAMDPTLGDLASAAAAGIIPWSATSTKLETGRMTIEASAGSGTEHSSRYQQVPDRNRHGLSFARVTLRGAGIEQVRIQLGERPGVTRIDWIGLKLWIQGEREPREMKLDGPEGFALLTSSDMFTLSPNLFISTSWRSELLLECRQFTDRAVSRLDIEVAFATIASGELLVGPGTAHAMLSAERDLRALRDSLSWRLTGPLRALKPSR